MIPHEPFLAFIQENDKRKKHDNVWKNHLKGLGVFTHPHMEMDVILAAET